MADGSERRRHPRKDVDLPAEYQIGEGPRTPGRLDQMSVGGSFVETTAVPSFGTAITLHLSLPGADHPLALPAIVRWTSGGGMGVQFGALGARETYELTEYLGKL